MNDDFNKWSASYKEKIDKISSSISSKISYRTTKDEITNLCLFALWKIYKEVKNGDMEESSVNRALYTYCWKAILSELQKEKYIKDDGSPHPFFNHYDIQKYDSSVNLDFIDVLCNKEMAEIAISLANENERNYIQAVFYDGMTLMEAAKKLRVHDKTVSYHLRKFIKRVREEFCIKETKIQLNFNVADCLSHARLGIPLS